MGELDKDASLIVFTYAKKLGSRFKYWEAPFNVHTSCGMHPNLRVVLLLCSLALTACNDSCFCT